VTIPWLSSCRSELVVLDNKHGYLEGWIQDPANSLKHYQGQGGPWILASWILHTVFKPAFTGKVFSLTTAPLTATIHVSYLSALLSAALALMLLLTLFYSSGWNNSPVCLHHNGIWCHLTAEMLSPHQTYPTPPLSLTETLLVPFYFIETLYQHIHHPLQT